MPKLSIIIVSHNTKDLLVDCLNSLPTPSANQEIIVVDNASSDGTLARLSKHFPEVTLIKNNQNLGYAAANNLGIKKSQGDYLLLLNSDTYVHHQALKHLVDFMDSHSKVGIASPQLLNSDGTIQQNGGALPNLTNLFTWFCFLAKISPINRLIPPYQQSHQDFYKKTGKTGWVSGAAMIIRRQVLDQIGNLDQNIFMYGEDTDLCYRATKANWHVFIVASAQVTHLGHGSGDQARALLGEVTGLKHFFSKHKPAWQRPLLSLTFKIGATIRLFVFGKISPTKNRYEVYKQISHLA